MPALSDSFDHTLSLDPESSGLIGGSVHTSHASGNIAICVPHVGLKTSGTWDKQIMSRQQGIHVTGHFVKEKKNTGCKCHHTTVLFCFSKLNLAARS